ncbi:MAG: hypothetical protein KKH92_06210, partial [Firmicutes bacterium]|nr:hypothetical protein [Bacillota bacterium]
NNNQYVDEITLDVIPSMRIDEKIVIYQVIFHNLSIGIRYQVSAYASDFDGIFEFNDVFVALAQAEFQ